VWGGGGGASRCDAQQAAWSMIRLRATAARSAAARPARPPPPLAPPHLLEQLLEAVDQHPGVALAPRSLLGGHQRQLRHLGPKHSADGGHDRLALVPQQQGEAVGVVPLPSASRVEHDGQQVGV
jgi:hypothetical protein